MKFTKMSLVAALLIGSSAFAIENTKVTGDVSLYYMTTDDNTFGTTTHSGNLFSADQSAADIGLNLNLTTDLFKNDAVAISAGAGMTALATLGLEQVLVDNVWGGAHGITGNTSGRGAHVDTPVWMNEAWLAVTTGKTTAKLGRMTLDTPLAFTETWTIEKNTFEAVVLINQDIPNTTLVGAYVGNGNGTENLHGGLLIAGPVSTAAVVNQGGEFDTYGQSGAYAIGAINNSFEPLTVQAWYYAVKDVANAYWLQADLNIDGIIAGAQYTDVSAVAANTKSDNVYALMIGYDMKDTVTAKLAYSQTNDNGSIGYAGFNTATAVGTAKSKLYTEAWWNYGQVTQRDTSAINLTVESPVNGMVDLGLYMTMIDHGANASANANTKPLEATLTAGKSFGPLDVTAAYIYFDKDQTGVSASNSIQAYLTVNF
jgi:hypothetical protein